MDWIFVFLPNMYIKALTLNVTAFEVIKFQWGHVDKDSAMIEIVSL